MKKGTIRLVGLLAVCAPLATLAQGEKEFTLRAQLAAVERGKVVVMGFTSKSMSRDTFTFDNHTIRLDIAAKDTAKVTLKLLCDELATPTVRLGNHYPNVELMLVPGETANLKIKAEKGKTPRVEWENGGPVSADFIRLNYQLTPPAEWSYRQLSIDNMVCGGDIRNYKKEFEAYRLANKQVMMDFIRNNQSSFVTAMYLLDHYNWFDENEIEQIYGHFPPEVRNNASGRTIGRRLENGRDYRSGTIAPDFVKKDMQGRTVASVELKGKYVLLDFWGSWCGPCRESHPHLRELNRKYDGRVIFINVANEMVKELTEARKLWQKAVKEDGMTWTQILNNEGVEEYNLVKLFHITAFPTKILINPEGKIAARLVGAAADADEVLEKLVGK